MHLCPWGILPLEGLEEGRAANHTESRLAAIEHCFPLSRQLLVSARIMAGAILAEPRVRDWHLGSWAPPFPWYCDSGVPTIASGGVMNVAVEGNVDDAGGTIRRGRSSVGDARPSVVRRA